MKITKFDQARSDFDEVMAAAMHHLATSRLVAIPTETVYGLAGDATDGVAIARIFETKKRPQFNPLIAHVSGMEMAGNIGVFDRLSQKLATTFWPGPLTLIVAQNPMSRIHDLVTAGLETIAVRCPGGPAGALIKSYGSPLAAPSANLSGKLSATSAQHVAGEFRGEDILVLDGGDCVMGIESTIAQVQADRIIILRAGSISAEQLGEVANCPVEFAPASSAITAPGMMASHYAPRAQVILECTSKLPDSAMLAFGNSHERGDLNLSERGDLREAAANLYRQLRQLDGLGMDKICVAPIPRTGLGIAINDRLARAAAPRNSTGN